MDQLLFRAPAWFHAITLTERIVARRAGKRIISNPRADAELAGERLQRWRSQYPFTTDSYFVQRLAINGVTEDELHTLLGEPIETVRDDFSTSPAWLMALADGFRCADADGDPAEGVWLADESDGFLTLIESLIDHGRKRFRQALQALVGTRSGLPFDSAKVEAILAEDLPEQLVWMMSRTLALELNVARLQGFLEGDSPADRFQSFIRRLRKRDVALALLQEYPVLARQLAQRIDQWVIVSLELVERLIADWDAIRAMFSPGRDPGLLVEVESDVGDRHRGGRAVMIVSFDSGFKLVYKPKPLAVDRHVQELLVWLNERGDHSPFRTLQILDRGTYGWEEFVTAHGCTTPEELGRFYERQGGYLALLYALEATDFHFENLIAAGEHPVLLDLESLFHPRAGTTSGTELSRLVGHSVAYSVLRVGLLPQRVWSNADSEGIDISGLGFTAGQLTPHRVPTWEGVNTDEMRFVRTRVAMPEGRHRPTLNGADVDLLEHAEAIVRGFTSVYRLLLNHRDELLADDGPLARFSEDEVRVVMRPTRTYAMLLNESFHPDVLRDALERDRLLDRLWGTVDQRPALAKVIAAECADLQRGDIPLFTTQPGSRDVWSSSNEHVAEFFEEPGMALVQRRVRQLNENDLVKQLWFIRASLATLPKATQMRGPTYRLAETEVGVSRGRLIAAACAVADRLEALALRSDQDATWIGLKLIGKSAWSLVPLSSDLYDGLSGIALFLAYLGMLTHEERYTALARATVSAMRFQIEQSRRFITTIGGFEGWGGIVYALSHLAVLWDQPELLAEAEAIVQCLPEQIERDEVHDIIGGAAGCIGSLISLYRCAPSEQTLAAAIQCGDRLIARAQPMECGIGWISRAGPTPLTGFSHGAAGIAWSLLELAALTGEERFRAAALEAIAYERSLFVPAMGNWPDLRDPEVLGLPPGHGQPQFMNAWCHGSPGIGLGRLRALPYLDDQPTRAEIDTALRTTLTAGFGTGHSLCHGDLGNLELFLQAGDMLGDSGWYAQANRIGAIVLESIRTYGWICGVPLGVETPGLMTGLAGIGYGLLRLADPAHVPAVLALAPPLQVEPER